MCSVNKTHTHSRTKHAFNDMVWRFPNMLPEDALVVAVAVPSARGVSYSLLVVAAFVRLMVGDAWSPTPSAGALEAPTCWGSGEVVFPDGKTTKPPAVA